ncbi:MAG: hypothetical protein IBJ11_02695 [Phycisphaerales bacterium]|nr:hypothetical protein [Phycisphaerales bacterium]
MTETTSRPRGGGPPWAEILTWAATAVMLSTYFAFTAGWLKPGVSFFLCQLAGQVALTAMSVAKRAWQPAAANGAFGVASVLGLIRAIAGG